MRLGVAAALVGGTIVPGDVEIADGAVVAIGVAPAGSHGLAVPGFVDLQVNGFAGVDFLHAGPDEYAAAGLALPVTGVTAYQPTFITAHPDDHLRALGVLSAVGPRPGGGARILGAHLEGPFLSPEWPGAHPPELIRDPDPDLLDLLLDAGPVTTMTLAPERPGGLELVSALVAAGVVAHLGHTDADAAIAGAAFDRGARALTHVFNGHRRFAARDPGPAGVALTRSDVTVTAILDGIHLADETERLVVAAAGDRLALITDAIAAAALGDGDYRLGDVAVAVHDGISRRDDGTLAGSVVTMDASLRVLAGHGVPVERAVHAAATAAADLVGRPDLGRLAVGLPADVVVLDGDLQVVRTLVAGAEVFAAPAP